MIPYLLIYGVVTYIEFRYKNFTIIIVPDYVGKDISIIFKEYEATPLDEYTYSFKVYRGGVLNYLKEYIYNDAYFYSKEIYEAYKELFENTNIELVIKRIANENDNILEYEELNMYIPLDKYVVSLNLMFYNSDSDMYEPGCEIEYDIIKDEINTHGLPYPDEYKKFIKNVIYNNIFKDIARKIIYTLA